MNAVDTNVLIYAHDPRYPQKQQTATKLVVDLVDGGLVWQVACEYLAASRKVVSAHFSYEDAVQRVRDLRIAWTTVLPTFYRLGVLWTACTPSAPVIVCQRGTDC